MSNRLKTIIREEIDNLSGKDIKINDNFWRWFGDSKIKQGGMPTICYHGTKSENLRKFTLTRDIGYHFAISKKVAHAFSGKIWVGDDDFGYHEKLPPLEVFLRVENFTYIPDLELWRYDDLLEELERQNKYGETKMNFEYDKTKSLLDNMKLFSIEYSEVNIDYKSIDGFIYSNRYENQSSQDRTSIVVFNSNQIKSIHNDGSWDINNIDIFS